MNLDSLDSGDNKRQNFIEGACDFDRKSWSLNSKTGCDEYFESGQKMHLDQFGQELLDAENHCNQLKAELQQYRKGLPFLSKSLDTSLENIPRMASHGEYIPVKEPRTSHFHSIKLRPIRQTSRFIDTDNSGAAVVTINHILSGITESVNKLSSLQSHFEKDATLPNVEVPKLIKYDEPKSNPESADEPESSGCSLIEEIPVCSPEVQMTPKQHPKTKKKHKIRQRIVSSNPQDLTQIPNKLIKVTAKRVNKKAQLHTVKTSMIFKDSRSTVKSKHPKFLGTMASTTKSSFSSNKTIKNTTENLVELYHNKAVKGSDSDVELNKDKKKKRKREKKIEDEIKVEQEVKVEENIVPPLDIKTIEKKPHKNISELVATQPETNYQEPAAPRTQCSVFSKSYNLPTIASKLKEVAKTYLHAFNIHMIPFCPATSTTPSHNIGINIQQVLNIIKTRQPVCSISPTLAHNIGLAAEKLNSQPLHALVSTLSSRMTYGRSQCPLLKNNVNYQQLQEMAKDIPEEEAADENGQEEPTKDTNDNNKTQIVWTIDQNKHLQCTCVPSQNVGFNQVFNKYTSASKSTNLSYPDFQMKQQLILNNTPITAGGLKPKNTRVTTLRRNNKRINEQRQWMKPTKAASSPQNTRAPVDADEQRKKTLKDVLQNLHDEFDALNRKYETLSQRINSNQSETTERELKELEIIEKELSNKEEEINMVITLYKEVAALKEQVKILRKRASQSSVNLNVKSMQVASTSRAAIHLQKLLRQIRNIHQIHCSASGLE